MAMPNQDVKIAALVAGRVVAMNVAEGDYVKAGQVVADIDLRPLDDQKRQAAAALAQAKAELENAKLNLNRTERLFERGIAAGKEVEDARTQLATAEAAVEQATAALDTADRQVSRTHVASPIAGQVVKRLVNVGEQVDGTAAQPIVEVANLNQVEIAADIPAEHLGRVRVGQGGRLVGRLRRPDVRRNAHRDRAGRRPRHQHRAGARPPRQHGTAAQGRHVRAGAASG